MIHGEDGSGMVSAVLAARVRALLVVVVSVVTSHHKPLFLSELWLALHTRLGRKNFALQAMICISYISSIPEVFRKQRLNLFFLNINQVVAHQPAEQFVFGRLWFHCDGFEARRIPRSDRIDFFLSDSCCACRQALGLLKGETVYWWVLVRMIPKERLLIELATTVCPLKFGPPQARVKSVRLPLNVDNGPNGG